MSSVKKKLGLTVSPTYRIVVIFMNLIIDKQMDEASLSYSSVHSLLSEY